MVGDEVEEGEEAKRTYWFEHIGGSDQCWLPWNPKCSGSQTVNCGSLGSCGNLPGHCGILTENLLPSRQCCPYGEPWSMAQWVKGATIWKGLGASALVLCRNSEVSSNTAYLLSMEQWAFTSWNTMLSCMNGKYDTGYSQWFLVAVQWR